MLGPSETELRGKIGKFKELANESASLLEAITLPDDEPPPEDVDDDDDVDDTDDDITEGEHDDDDDDQPSQ